MFEEKFNGFLEEQKRNASGQRLAMLEKDLTGEKKMLETVIWPVLKSFEGLTLEYELVSFNGAKIYIDVFYQPLLLAFESEGFVSHAENITRDRFTFERMRARTIAAYGYKYIPFSWDELNKKPESCQRFLYGLIGLYSSDSQNVETMLSAHEKELIRFALRLNRPFRLDEASNCLGMGRDASRKVLRQLLDKQLLKTLGKGTTRVHSYMLARQAAEYIY